MIPAEEKMLRLLSKNDVTFFIPPYQRNYEWTDTQCAVFLEDVVKTYNANISGKRTEHFLDLSHTFSLEWYSGNRQSLC